MNNGSDYLLTIGHILILSVMSLDFAVEFATPQCIQALRDTGHDVLITCDRTLRTRAHFLRTSCRDSILRGRGPLLYEGMLD